MFLFLLYLVPARRGTNMSDAGDSPQGSGLARTPIKPTSFPSMPGGAKPPPVPKRTKGEAIYHELQQLAVIMDNEQAVFDNHIDAKDYNQAKLVIRTKWRKYRLANERFKSQTGQDKFYEESKTLLGECRCALDHWDQQRIQRLHADIKSVIKRAKAEFRQEGTTSKLLL